jgi:hypothetical protein
MELINDVCIAGNSAINGQCGNPECVCYNEDLCFQITIEQISRERS